MYQRPLSKNIYIIIYTAKISLTKNVIKCFHLPYIPILLYAFVDYQMKNMKPVAEFCIFMLSVRLAIFV